MNPPLGTVLTIGHSTHSVEAFIALLRQHSVQAVADVRSRPFSRFNPQFDRGALESSLRSVGMKYAFLGRELGARSDDPGCYVDGKVQYARLADTPAFKDGLRRVRDGAKRFRLALMCAEKEPLECHRTVLVARALVAEGVAVAHILADSRLEAHDATMTRLLDMVGLPQSDLFRSREELVREALERQEERIAYVETAMKADAAEDER
jgi:uncharacterized protein (DUF488 family)